MRDRQEMLEEDGVSAKKTTRRKAELPDEDVTRALGTFAQSRHHQPPLEYPIEDGIPIPPRNGLSERTKTLLRLKVGESILCDEFSHTGKANKVCTALKAHQPGYKYITRTIKGGGVRIWRIK